MSLLGYVNTHIPLAKVQLYVGGKMADALAYQATPSHQQPGPDQADHHHYRDSKDAQKQLVRKAQQLPQLSEQYGTSTLPYLSNLPFKNFHFRSAFSNAMPAPD